jgi:hypothetical protein
MWQLALSIPIPNWSGICLGMIIMTVLIFALAAYSERKKPN